MKIIRTVADMRGAVARERTIGLVPTMGALHAGHRSLIDRARGENDQVVMSLFVNPTQFGPGEDLDAYPRDEASDLDFAREAGVDVLFAPSAADMYPAGFATTVQVSGVTEPLEGARRGPGHFTGVATIVCKLLNIVGADVAYFGQKDAQQAVVIRRLVADLNIPTVVRVCPTVRDDDGLALSSRNRYLDQTQRAQALGLSAALTAAARGVAEGERRASAAIALATATLEAHRIKADYVAVVDPETLAPVDAITAPVLVAIAAKVGGTRLIDNVIATP